MKSIVSVLLALVLGISAVSAQAPAGSSPDEATRPAAAPAEPPKDEAVTRVTNPAPARTAAPKPGAAYVPPQSGKDSEMTLLKLVESGGWAMVPLGAMSIITVMLVLVFLATLRRSAILTPHYMNTADVLLKKRDYLGLLAISSRHPEAVARVVQRTLDFATKNPGAGFEVVKQVAESEGGAQASSFQCRVSYLADIGMLSPMVGLFGTVWGIIEAFGELGSTQMAGKRDVLIAAGVSKALIATGAGLIIGIVAFVFYAFFRNKVQRLISDLEVASAHVVGLMALNFKKREPSRATLEEEF